METPAAAFAREFDPIPSAGEIGLSPTSGYRTQAHQDALVGQGLTETRRSAHTRGDAIDFAVPQGMSKEQAITEVLRRFPGAKAIPTNGGSIHVTFPGWGGAPDVSGSRRRYGN